MVPPGGYRGRLNIPFWSLPYGGSRLSKSICKWEPFPRIIFDADVEIESDSAGIKVNGSDNLNVSLFY